MTPAAASGDRIDAYVLSELKRQHVPGAWVMVRKNGRVLKERGYGIANLEDGAPVTANTLMQTGSIGKMFTAAGIMLLVQDRKLRLSDSIATYFPGAPDWWKPITIAELLSHTAGVPEYEGTKYDVDLTKDYTEDQLIKLAQAMKPDAAAGKQWAYSNTDYVILGVLIHRLTGQFYGDFLKERVWQPNNLPTMRVISDREVIPHRSAGYDWESGRWLNQEWVSPSLNSTADGTLYATPADFVAWDEALDNYAVVGKDLQEAMWTPVTLKGGIVTDYGFGWEVGDLFGHPYVGHTGIWQGFKAAYYRFRDDRLSVAVFANCSTASPDEIAFGIAGRYGPVPEKENLKPIPSDPSELEAVRRIALALAGGSAPRVPIGGSLVTISDESIDRWKLIGNGAGPLDRIDLVYASSGPKGYRVYRATFQNGTFWLQLHLNTSGLLAYAQLI